MDDQMTPQSGQSEMNRPSESQSGSQGGESSANNGSGNNMGEGASNGTMDQARSMVRNVGEQARNMVSGAGSTAQDLARRAREGAGSVTDTLYQQGGQAGEYISRRMDEYPVTALLVAGAIGYGLAYLIHNNWSSWGNWSLGGFGWGDDNGNRGGQRRRDNDRGERRDDRQQRAHH